MTKWYFTQNYVTLSNVAARKFSCTIQRIKILQFDEQINEQICLIRILYIVTYKSRFRNTHLSFENTFTHKEIGKKYSLRLNTVTLT